jgi:hypothetical protein
VLPALLGGEIPVLGGEIPEVCVAHTRCVDRMSYRTIPDYVHKYTHLSLDFMSKIAYPPLSSAVEA